jgi:hypothetical protein
MSRYITVSIDKRGVRARARLLDDLAPGTCEAVWNALPLSASAYHAKYARNEIYGLFPAFAPTEPGMENPTVTPIPGDLMYFTFEPWQIGNAAYGYEPTSQAHSGAAVVDLALFYGRNNLLINGDQGWVVGRVWGAVEEGLPELADAAQDMWLRGVEGETLSFARE